MTEPINKTSQILIEIRTLVLTAGQIKTVDMIGYSYFMLKENSSTTTAQIGIGKNPLQPWPLLYSCDVRELTGYFDKITFQNTGAGPMTLVYIVSNCVIDNKTAKILDAVVIDDTSDTIDTPGAITVLPAAAVAILIDVDEPVDVGGGVVGIPATAHPFFPGNAVTITGCPQYNGAYIVLPTTAINQVDITAVFNGGLLDNAAAVDAGGGVVSIPITAHPYTPGETIRIAGTVNYNDDYVVLASSTADFVDITEAYNAEVFAGTETHNLVFDGVNDSIGLTNPNFIPGDSTRKELHITNHDAANEVFWGDNNVNADAYRGVIIAPTSVYILTCTADVYLSVPAALAAGVIVSWNNLTKT